MNRDPTQDNGIERVGITTGRFNIVTEKLGVTIENLTPPQSSKTF